MNRSELKKVIAECCNDVVFVYNGKKSGVTAEVHNSVPTFQVWHGADTKDFSNVDELMSDKFFSGKSIDELSETVDFLFS